MDPRLSLSLELLELIIDELGAQIESDAQASSIVFQTLLNFALAGPRVVPRCQRYLLRTLSFCSPREKGRKTPAWQHMQTSLSIFKTSPQLALYVRRLVFKTHNTFPKDQIAWREPQSLKERLSVAGIFYETFLDILWRLSNLESLVLVGFFKHLQVWADIPDKYRERLCAYLCRESGNRLKELELYSFRLLERKIFTILPPTLRVLRMGKVTFNSAEGDFQPEKWRYRLQELSVEGNFDIVKSMQEWRDGWQLDRLTALGGWITTSEQANCFNGAIVTASFTLCALDLSVYGHSIYLSTLIDSLPLLPNLVSLTMMLEMEGFKRGYGRTVSRCPSALPKALRDMVLKVPALETLRIHAAWSYRGETDVSKRFYFIDPSFGWRGLDTVLGGDSVPHLRDIFLKANPQATSIACQAVLLRSSMHPRLSPDLLKKADDELLAAFVETKEKHVRVHRWNNPDDRWYPYTRSFSRVIV